MDPENSTIIASGQDASQLHTPDREVIFQEYSSAMDEFPVVAQVMNSAPIVEGNQEFKYDILPQELRYVNVAPAGGSTVGVYTATNYTSSQPFTTAGSTPITTAATVANVASASSAGTLAIRISFAESKRVHLMEAYDVKIQNSRNKDGGTVTAIMPGACKVEVRQMVSGDSGYVILFVKVVNDEAVSGKSTLAQAAATGASVTLSCGCGALPEGHGLTGGHIVHPFTVSNYTQMNARGFSATRSRIDRKEAWSNMPSFWDRLVGQNRAAALCALESQFWFGKKDLLHAQEGDMYDLDSGIRISGDRWFSGGLRDFLLTATNSAGEKPYADHVMYVPDLEGVGSVELTGKTNAQGLYDLYRGIGEVYSMYNTDSVIPVYLGPLAYSDTLAVLESMFSRQMGQMSTDKIGFTVRKLEIDGKVFEFRKHLRWSTDRGYERMMGIVKPEDCKMHIFGDDGKFQEITQSEKMPKRLSVPSTWVDGTTGAFVWDIGFSYRNPEGMFLVDGVGLDFKAS